MVKTRRGWYLVDVKTDEIERREKDEKDNKLERSRIAIVKRADDKIVRRHLQAKQQEIHEKEKLSRIQKAIDLKQREVDVTHRLAAELSRRKNEEIKRELKSSRVKLSAPSLSNCALDEARSRLLEKKIHLEASQMQLLKLWHQDETVKKLQQDEEKKKKLELRVDLQNQIADNRRRMQEKKTEEKKQDSKMVEQTMREIREEDAKMKKKKKNDAIFLRAELAAILAAKDAWEKKYKEALTDEDKRIVRIVAEKEARQKKILDKKAEFRLAKEVAIDKVANKLLENVRTEKKQEEISNKLYQHEQRSKWAKEPARLALRKQYAIAKCLKDMADQGAKKRETASSTVQRCSTS